MLHQMKLQSGPFEKIKSGTKTVEIRLNDEKRQVLKVGDDIEFSLINDSSKKIKVRINELRIFKNFKELFNSYSIEQYGGGDWVGMYQYYSKEDENTYGVLGIGITLIG